MKDKRKVVTQAAYKKVPFYYRLANEKKLEVDKILEEGKWDLLPIITKDSFWMNQQSMINAEYMVENREKELQVSKTSGTSGKYLEILWNKKEYNESLIPLWIYRKKYYNINPSDRFCYFYTVPNGDLSKRENFFVEYRKNSIGFSKNGLDEEGLLKIYDIMKEFQPTWMNFQPSMAVLLGNVIQKYKLPKIESLTYMELTGEVLLESVREYLEQIFLCKIANQYGAYEVNSIAFECPEGALHCLNTNVFVEITENGIQKNYGEEGDVTITSLRNKVMPLIRYNIEDRGVLYSGSQCKCGNKNSILKLSYARKMNYIINEDGTKTNPYVFIHSLNIINSIYENVIRQIQIIQVDYKEFIIRFAVDIHKMEAYHPSEINQKYMECFIQPSLMDAIFHFEYYETLPHDDKNSKMQFFVPMKNKIRLH